MFTCLSLHLSKTTMNSLPTFSKFYRTELYHYEVTDNFTKTAGWVEEQDPTCALCRKLLKWSLYVLNKFTR